MKEQTLEEVRAWAAGASQDDELAKRVRALLQNGADPRAWDDIGRRADRASRRARDAHARSQARALLLLLDKAPSRVRRPGRTLVLGTAVALTLGAVAAEVSRAMFAPKVHVAGPDHGAAVGLAHMSQLAFVEEGDAGRLANERWELDGRDVTARVKASGGELVFRPRRIADGSHQLVITADGPFPGLDGKAKLNFSVDRTPPTIRLERLPTTRAWHPAQLEGTVDEQVRLSLSGRPVRLVDGHFKAVMEPPFAPAIPLVATDTAGNSTLQRVVVNVVPRRPPVSVRAVHVTAYGWANDDLRAGVLSLIAQHRINAVELDLKDEGGLVGFNPDVPLARANGAALPVYDLPAAVRQLHAKGVRVIGRLVAFRDPVLADSAWKAGRRDEVVQTADGKPYAGYGGFTNVASKAVRQYNIAIAVAAARAGVDDVLYDYVRRPDGPIDSMAFPGLKGSAATAVVQFLRDTRIALEPYGTYLGASVFGVAATRPDEVAQDVPAIARQVDYVAPMVYPSHWNPGEYDVPDPNGQPYLIVLRALSDFKRDVAGSGARVVPWLQDFSLGRTYTAKDVRAQIKAARKLGIDEYLLWDPAVTYNPDAIDPTAATSKEGLARPAPG